MTHPELPGRAVPPSADSTTGLLPQRGTWISYFRIKFLVFWLVITTGGLLLAVLPTSFSLKDLVSGAILGAGIAGIFSEFSFCSERRDDDIDRQVLQAEIGSLDRQLRRVDEITTDTVIVATLKTFKLGSWLAMVQYRGVTNALRESDLDDTRSQLKDLADILGMSRLVNEFLIQPDLLDPKVMVIFKQIQDAVQLRFSLAAQEAFNAGYTMMLGAFSPGNLSTPDGKRSFIFILRRALPLLYLPEKILDYVQQGLDQFERDEISLTPQLVGFLALFNLYIDSRVVKNNPKITRFFEIDQPSLTDQNTVNTMTALLTEVAGRGTKNDAEVTAPKQ
jgi:hypothetical protein